jgi:hypothetical protein
VGTGGSFPWQGHKADHLFPSRAEVKENMGLYIHSPIHLHGIVLNWLSTVTMFSPREEHMLEVFKNMARSIRMEKCA